MPTYHVQQTWRAKRPKTVVSHDLEIHLNLPKTNSPKVFSKRNSILKLEHFLKPYIRCTKITKRKKRRCYLKWFEAWGRLWLKVGRGRGDWDVGTGTWGLGRGTRGCGTRGRGTRGRGTRRCGTRGLGDSEWFTIRSWLFLVFLYVIRTHYSSTVPILISPHLFSSVIRQSEGDLALKSTSSTSQQVCFHSLLKYRECLVFFLDHCIFPYNIGITVGWIPNVVRVCLCMHVTNIS